MKFMWTEFLANIFEWGILEVKRQQTFVRVVNQGVTKCSLNAFDWLVVGLGVLLSNKRV